MQLRAITLGLPALLLTLAAAAPAATPCPDDWARLGAYRAANARLAPPSAGAPRVVFLGDSITEFWPAAAPSPFADPARLNRGISGQTTPQLLLRFRADVIDLKPRVVVILAGTNDLAGNTGPATDQEIAGNLASMVELARANGIRVVLASLLPASGYYWAPQVRPAPRIAALNAWIKAYAERQGLVHLDYHDALADAGGGLRREYSDDGVHPNEAGYRVMAPLAEAALRRALAMP